MLRVYACLTGQHDLRLVFLAALICLAACSASMKLFNRANAEKDRALSWLFGAACGVCPLATCMSIRSRPIGVKRAFL
ncbi:MAG: hypothetical protein ACREDJ_10465 [Methylocella sp.]